MKTIHRVAAASLCLLAVACGSSSEGEESSGTGALLPPPERGMQVTMHTELDPGVEAEHCQFYRVPEDGDLWVNDTDTRYNAGSHHVLLYRTPYQEIPTETNDGEPLDMSGVFDCSEGVTAMLDVDTVVAGSQSFEGGDTLNFPPNVAMKVEAGTLLLMNSHIINTTAKKQRPTLTINLETIPESDVEHEGGLLFFYNIFIHVGPQSTGKARSRCTLTDDIFLLNAQSHMHARGVNYVAEHRPAGSSAGQVFYENEDWEDVPVDTYGAGLEMKAGDELEYECTYNNPEMRDVFQGPRTTDEMCMFVGTYYPRKPELDVCATASGRGQIGMDWVGSGSKTCQESFDCAMGGITSNLGNFQGMLESLSTCIEASDPAVSKEMSAAVRCFFEKDDPLANCQPEFDACNAL